MKPELAAIIRGVRQRRLKLRQASKALSVQARETGGGVLSDLLGALAKEMEEMLDDIEALYESSYVQTQDTGTLAQAILDLPELKKDEELRRKIFTEFKKMRKRRR